MPNVIQPLPDAGVVPPDAASTPLAELLHLLEAGGPIMFVLAALSVITLTVMVAKLLQFVALRLWARRAVLRALELWHAGRADEAPPVLEAERGRSPRSCW